MIRLRPFAAVVFDMDGTLLDTELVFKQVLWEVSHGLGFTMRDEIHLGMIGVSNEVANALLVEAYGVAFPYELFSQNCRTAMNQRLSEAVPVKAGVRELLAELTRRGIPMAVATSSRRRNAEPHLRAAGLLDLFNAVVARDDVVNPKPHPEPYQTAARLLGIAPADCLAIEDSHSGARSAVAAGMQTILVPDLLAPTDEIRSLCAHVMASLHDVRQAAFGAAVAAG